MPSDWNWLKGTLDEVQIYSRALTAQEIRQQAGISPVGGIAEYPDVAESRLSATDPAGGSSSSPYAAIAGIAAAAVAIAAGGWYVRRRYGS